MDDFDPHLANETESEPEPDEEEYVDKPEKPRVKSAFVEEEADESEPEENGGKLILFLNYKWEASGFFRAS